MPESPILERCAGSALEILRLELQDRFVGLLRVEQLPRLLGCHLPLGRSNGLLGRLLILTWPLLIR